MNPYLQFAAVTVGMFLFELIWTECVVAVQKKSAMRASVFSVLLQFVSGAVTVAYVSNPSLLAACAIGAFTGTYYAVKRQPA